jgi:hypothetical protein
VDWKAKVDLFEQLRRKHEFGIATIAGVAIPNSCFRRSCIDLGFDPADHGEVREQRLWLARGLAGFCRS